MVMPPVNDNRGFVGTSTASVNGSGSIDAFLRNAVNGNGSLDQRIVNGVSNVLNEEVEFVPAVKPYQSSTKFLQSKYTHLVPAPVKRPDAACSNSPVPFSNGSENGSAGAVHCTNLQDSRIAHGPVDGAAAYAPRYADGIPKPKIDLYPTSVNMSWQNSRHPIGVGLLNQGNTCFLNSIIQALTHTAPLCSFLLDCHSRSDCMVAVANGYCSLCEMRAHIFKALMTPTKNAYGNVAIRPQVVGNIKQVMRSYQYGRQEDAHEFLRYLIDSMQIASLGGIKNSNKYDVHTKESSPIAKIFGGYLRNEIVCLRCHGKSTTYDPFFDISLELKGENVSKCLENFTRREVLQGDNAYQCANCRCKTEATKHYTIHRPPNILTIQLKRFGHGGKIMRHIQFSSKLDLRRYMSPSKFGKSEDYWLYAVVVHQGNSMNSGHYYAFVSTTSHQWYLMDDSRVGSVSLSNVMAQPAYLLFYRKASPVDLVNCHSEGESITPASAAASGVHAERGIASKPALSATVASPCESPAIARKANMFPLNKAASVSNLPSQQNGQQAVVAANSSALAHFSLSSPKAVSSSEFLSKQPPITYRNPNPNGKPMVITVSLANGGGSNKAPVRHASVGGGCITKSPVVSTKVVAAKPIQDAEISSTKPALVPYDEDDDTNTSSCDTTSQPNSAAPSPKVAAALPRSGAASSSSATPVAPVTSASAAAPTAQVYKGVAGEVVVETNRGKAEASAMQFMPRILAAPSKTAAVASRTTSESNPGAAINGQTNKVSSGVVGRPKPLNVVSPVKTKSLSMPSLVEDVKSGPQALNVRLPSNVEGFRKSAGAENAASVTEKSKSVNTQKRASVERSYRKQRSKSSSSETSSSESSEDSAETEKKVSVRPQDKRRKRKHADDANRKGHSKRDRSRSSSREAESRQTSRCRTNSQDSSSHSHHRSHHKHQHEERSGHHHHRASRHSSSERRHRSRKSPASDSSAERRRSPAEKHRRREKEPRKHRKASRSSSRESERRRHHRKQEKRQVQASRDADSGERRKAKRKKKRSHSPSVSASPRSKRHHHDGQTDHDYEAAARTDDVDESSVRRLHNGTSLSVAKQQKKKSHDSRTSIDGERQVVSSAKKSKRANSVERSPLAAAASSAEEEEDASSAQTSASSSTEQRQKNKKESKKAKRRRKERERQLRQREEERQRLLALEAKKKRKRELKARRHALLENGNDVIDLQSEKSCDRKQPVETERIDEVRKAAASSCNAAQESKLKSDGISYNGQTRDGTSQRLIAKVNGVRRSDDNAKEELPRDANGVNGHDTATSKKWKPVSSSAGFLPAGFQPHISKWDGTESTFDKDDSRLPLNTTDDYDEDDYGPGDYKNREKKQKHVKSNESPEKRSSSNQNPFQAKQNALIYQEGLRKKGQQIG